MNKLRLMLSSNSISMHSILSVTLLSAKTQSNLQHKDNVLIYIIDLVMSIWSYTFQVLSVTTGSNTIFSGDHKLNVTRNDHHHRYVHCVANAYQVVP